MIGKRVLKNVQHEGEQLLAFGKQLLELQQKLAQQKSNNIVPSSGNQIGDIVSDKVTRLLLSCHF